MWLGRQHCKAAFKIFNKTPYALTSCRGLVNFTEKSADLDFVYYKKCKTNSQNPVVILHGLLSSKKSWEIVSEAINLTTGRQVINVDARNHGASPHRLKNNYFDMMYDTVKLIKKMNLNKVTLLGHSMGGRTAMVLSLLYPELVSSMILIDISPVSISQQLKNNFPKVLDVVNCIHFAEHNYITVDDARKFAERKMHDSGITQKDITNFILKNVGVRSDGRIGWRPNMKVLREYFPTLLKFPYVPGKIYAGPTLFVKAEKSDFMTSADWPGIKMYFPQAQLELIHGASHNMQDQEDTSTLLKFIIQFLAKVP